MKTIRLDARGWRDPEDVYRTLLRNIGAPTWHGHNLDALAESIGDGLNTVHPPFQLVIRGSSKSPAAVQLLLRQIQSLFNELHQDGGIEIGIEFVP